MSRFMMQTFSRRHLVVLMLSALPVLWHPGPARADEAVRWKLSAGDELSYEIAKSSALSLGDDASAYKLTQTINVTWRVLEAGEAGVATIEQVVDRIRLELDDPLGEVRYDSEVDEEPGSLAALAATVFSAMLEHKITFQLTPDGTIEQIDIPEPLLEAVENVSFARSLDRFASAEGLRELLAPRLPVMPEGQLEPGQEWSTAVEQSSGRHQVEITYRYTGEREDDGQTLAVFEQTPTVTLIGEDDALKVRDQSASGELLFDRSEGRLTLNRWQVELRVEDTADQEGRLKQQFRMELER